MSCQHLNHHIYLVYVVYLLTVVSGLCLKLFNSVDEHTTAWYNVTDCLTAVTEVTFLNLIKILKIRTEFRLFRRQDYYE